MIFLEETDAMSIVSTHLKVGAAFAIAAAVGCSQQTPRGSFAVLKPETLQVDGTEWTRVEWTSTIDSKIASHFRRCPQLADNPSLNGDVVCYRNGSKQRVYWLTPVDDTCQWAMLELKASRRGELVEGSGAPFLELQIVDR